MPSTHLIDPQKREKPTITAAEQDNQSKRGSVFINRSKIPQKDACGCCVWILEPANQQTVTTQSLTEKRSNEPTAATEQDNQPKRGSVLLIAQKSRKKTLAAVASGLFEPANLQTVSTHSITKNAAMSQSQPQNRTANPIY